MAKTYFSQYIDDVDKIAKEYWHKHDMVSIALADARKRNEKAQANSEYSRDKKTVAAAAFREAEREYKKAVESIQNEMVTSFKALRQSLAKHIAEYTAADPGKVDQNAVVLLNSGVMRDTDLVAMANKYWNNPTMLKLIAGEAEKNLTDSKTARYLAVKIAEYISPDARLRVFDSAVDAAKRTVSQSESYSASFQKFWSGEAYNALKTHMSNLDTFSTEVM